MLYNLYFLSLANHRLPKKKSSTDNCPSGKTGSKYDLNLMKLTFVLNSNMKIHIYIVSSRVGTPPPSPFSEGTSSFWVPPSFWWKFKKLPQLCESHPNWCMQIVRNTLKWRCHNSYYTKSIGNIINITLFTFRLNSVFTTDTFFG